MISVISRWKVSKMSYVICPNCKNGVAVQSIMNPKKIICPNCGEFEILSKSQELKIFNCSNLTEAWISLLKFHLTSTKTYSVGWPLYNRTKCLLDIKSLSHIFSTRDESEIINYLGYIKKMKMVLLLSSYFNPYKEDFENAAKVLCYQPKTRVIMLPKAKGVKLKCIDSIYFTRIKGTSDMEVLFNFRVTEVYRRFLFDTFLISHICNFMYQRTNLKPKVFIYIPFLYTSSFFVGSAKILLKKRFHEIIKLGPEVSMKWNKILQNPEKALNYPITWIRKAFEKYWNEHRKYNDSSEE